MQKVRKAPWLRRFQKCVAIGPCGERGAVGPQYPKKLDQTLNIPC